MKLNSNSIFAPVNLLLIIVNIIVFNLISNEIFGRLDLTENQVYTLSDVTKQIVRDLDETLTIKAYFTRDLPAPYNNISRFVEDNLAEMKANSKGKLRYEFLDPSDEEELKKEAEKFRLEPIQVNEMRADKVEFKLAYLGMVLIYEDRQEVIPAIQSLGNLEYEIVTKIRRVTTDETLTLGFLEGHGEPTLKEEMTGLDRELRKLYDIKPVNFSNSYKVPDDIDLLCIVGPKEDIPAPDQFAIDQYIMKGGKVIMALNKVKTDLSQMSAERSPLRIDGWTESYGFRFSDDLIMDRNAPTLPFQMMTRYGARIMMVVYPLFPEIINFNRDNPALKVLRQVRLYFPSSIDTSLVAEKENITVTPLFWTSEKSGIQSQPYDINPLTERPPLVYDQKSLPVGVVLQGEFTSFWKDKTIPNDEEGNPITDEEIVPKSPDTRIIVIGDGNFIQDQYLVQTHDNLTLMLNLVDWMTQDERLIGIRSREVASRPIGEVTDATRRTVKYANLLLPPLLVIGFGIFRWRIRQANRKRVLKDFSGKGQGGEI